jgi:hypothetical protein
LAAFVTSSLIKRTKLRAVSGAIGTSGPSATIRSAPYGSNACRSRPFKVRNCGFSTGKPLVDWTGHQTFPVIDNAEPFGSVETSFRRNLHQPDPFSASRRTCRYIAHAWAPASQQSSLICTNQQASSRTLRQHLWMHFPSDGEAAVRGRLSVRICFALTKLWNEATRALSDQTFYYSELKYPALFI